MMKKEFCNLNWFKRSATAGLYPFEVIVFILCRLNPQDHIYYINVTLCDKYEFLPTSMTIRKK